MKLAIIANPEKYAVKEPFMQILLWADEHSSSVFFSHALQPLYDGDDHASSVITKSEEEAIKRADIVVAMGGDGTMLYTARLLRDHAKPVLGVNSGRLGFMANTQKENLAQALAHLQEENYRLEKRFMLKATTADGSTFHALNEFLFSKKDSTSMINVDAEYDGMFINEYWADGLIVASPTGSTAYNLSSGGPIVMPDSNVMVLTPINPHTLTTCPLVLPSHRSLKITAPEQSDEVLFSYDGKICDLQDYPLSIEIKRSDFSIDLIQLPDQNYFNTLRHKLMWGMDFRKRL